MPKVKLNIPKRTEKNYPLLRTLNEAISLSLDEMTQENNLDVTNEISNGNNDRNSQSNNKNDPSNANLIISSFSLTAIAITLLKSF